MDTKYKILYSLINKASKDHISVLSRIDYGLPLPAIFLEFYDLYLDFSLKYFDFSRSSQSAIFSSYIFILRPKTCSNIKIMFFVKEKSASCFYDFLIIFKNFLTYFL